MNTLKRHPPIKNFGRAVDIPARHKVSEVLHLIKYILTKSVSYNSGMNESKKYI
jgi:hypothetical protein